MDLLNKQQRRHQPVRKQFLILCPPNRNQTTPHYQYVLFLSYFAIWVCFALWVLAVKGDSQPRKARVAQLPSRTWGELH